MNTSSKNAPDTLFLELRETFKEMRGHMISNDLAKRDFNRTMASLTEKIKSLVRLMNGVKAPSDADAEVYALAVQYISHRDSVDNGIAKRGGTDIRRIYKSLDRLLWPHLYE